MTVIRPFISVVTVVKNGGKTIADAIQSIISQNYIDFEYIIIDGVSSDNTLQVISSYQHIISRFVSEPDNGIYDAMNKGIDLAKGQVIGFLNADDVYENDDVLQNVADVMSDHAVDSCYGDLLYVKQDDIKAIVRYWRSSPVRQYKFYRGWIPPHPTFFVRKSVYEKYCGFRTDLGQAADYELMLRLLLLQGISSVYIPQVLVRMRTGGVTNASAYSNFENHRSTVLAWKVNNVSPRIWTLPLRSCLKLYQYIFPRYRLNLSKL